jgi:hypothetical protein
MNTTIYKVACSLMFACIMPFISLSQEKKSEKMTSISAKEPTPMEVQRINEPVKIDGSSVIKLDPNSTVKVEIQNPQAQATQIPLSSGKHLTMYQIKYDSYGHATVNLPTVGQHEIYQVTAISGKWIKVNFMGAAETYQGWINTDDTSCLYVQW